jgi:hypothetical protein
MSDDDAITETYSIHQDEDPDEDHESLIDNICQVCRGINQNYVCRNINQPKEIINEESELVALLFILAGVYCTIKLIKLI